MAAVVLVSVYFIVRWSRKLDALFPEAARKYGVSFTREKRGGFLGNILDSSRLTGVVDGTPLEGVSTYQTRGRARMRSTLVASPAPGLLPCTINISHRRPAADVHLVPTGGIPSSIASAGDRVWSHRIREAVSSLDRQHRRAPGVRRVDVPRGSPAAGESADQSADRTAQTMTRCVRTFIGVPILSENRSAGQSCNTWT